MDRVGNHRTTVGMANQDHRARCVFDDIGHVVRIALNTVQRVGDSDDRIPLGLQAGNHPVPAGRLGKGAVYQDHGGFLAGFRGSRG